MLATCFASLLLLAAARLLSAGRTQFFFIVLQCKLLYKCVLLVILKHSCSKIDLRRTSRLRSSLPPRASFLQVISTHSVERAGLESAGYVTKPAPHKALKLIFWGPLTFKGALGMCVASSLLLAAARLFSAGLSHVTHRGSIFRFPKRFLLNLPSFPATTRRHR